MHIVWLIVGCFLLVKAAEYAVRSISNVGRVMRMSEFIISFIVVGIISTFPEFFVSVVAAVKGFPTLAFGTLIGSNVADLTVVIALMVLFGGTIRVGTKALRYDFFYLVLAAVPILLALDGMLSRLDGAVLVLLCIVFFYHMITQSYHFRKVEQGIRKRLLWDVILFTISVIVLFFSANMIVKYAELLALDWGIRKIFIGLVLIALGTTLPELTFGIKALKKGLGDLALGDVLGNVIIDATFVLGVVALIAPIQVSLVIVTSVGFFMVLGMFILITIIERGHHVLTKKHAWWLLGIYIMYLVVTVTISHLI
ncbi:MAG TPA: sodium:calcium antiporter [Candidatus Nanoarchaeia archaeon]|nr:sodium:calcium antiporter [Candidatus Nanoarchaeia archaeon]